MRTAERVFERQVLSDEIVSRYRCARRLVCPAGRPGTQVETEHHLPGIGAQAEQLDFSLIDNDFLFVRSQADADDRAIRGTRVNGRLEGKEVTEAVLD